MAFTSYSSLLQSYQDALVQLSTGVVEEYAIGSRRLRYRNLGEIREMIDWINLQINQTSNTGWSVATMDRPR